MDHFVAIYDIKLGLWSVNAPNGAKFILTSVALTFEVRHWPFAWTSRLSMVITLDKFMMMRWQEHCKQVSFKKEVGVMVIDLVFWLTVCLILKMCY